jgi:hypothetical protein
MVKKSNTDLQRELPFEKHTGSLESKILESDTQENIKTISEQDTNIKNIRENFGITEEMLKVLSYQTLKAIFYGIQNFDYAKKDAKPADITKLYLNMTSTEILGLWAGIGRKEKTYIRPEIIKSISSLVSAGYELSSHTNPKKNEHNLGYIAQKKKNMAKYSTKPGEMKKRLANIDYKTLQEVINRLNAPKRYNEKEKNTCRGEKGFDEHNLIYDPNCDSPSASRDSKIAYINRISNMISSTYSRT